MITLSQGQYLSDVMDMIPSGCILSKRIPGCGATTLELQTDRSSIIIVPNVPVIISKCKKYPNMLGVYENITIHQVAEYLMENHTHKIMTTPESFCKVKSACEKCGIDIYSDFFLLMDECHQLIADVDYRIDIVMPMNDFFLFENKALVSATPIEFSDPRFKENHIETIEIVADYDYRQDITVTHTYNIGKAVGEYLENHDGTICVFLNSITTIYSIMNEFGLFEESAVYCAPKSKTKLKVEYGFNSAYTEWSADTMKKYNFFTARFFTAFDLELNDKPEMVMVSDPYLAEYSMLDIDTDCIQICGRFRNGIKSATHIYRTNPEITVKSREQIEWEISAHEFAYNTFETYYNSAETRESRFAFGEAMETLPFRKYQYPDFTKNWFAIDNAINNVLVQGKYQSEQSIKEWYKSCHFFFPIFRHFHYDENDDKLKIIRAGRSLKDKRKRMVQLLSENKEPVAEYSVDFTNKIREIDPFIVNAYEVLGKERIEELKYSERKMRENMIIAERKGNKVVRLIKNRFTVGRDYLNETIVNEISRIFETLNIHPEKEIKPSNILDYFQAIPFKRNGKRGYSIVSAII